MSRLVQVVYIASRIFAATALSLGLAFWLGYARSLTRVHIALGTGLVVRARILPGGLASNDMTGRTVSSS
jgi:hypothetical protein